MTSPTIVAASCPYCRAPIEADEESLLCADCATPHHADCYAENGGCTVFGCAKAPVDEPKISITTSELSRPVQPSGLVTSAPTPPPPPRPGSTTAVAPPPSTRSNGPARIIEDTTRYLTPPRNLSFGGYNDTPEPAAIPAYIPRRHRLNYILYGAFLGSFGAHNFYAGYMKRAAGQLLLTVFVLLAGGAFWGGLVSWIWAIVEICTVKEDDDGVAFI